MKHLSSIEIKELIVKQEENYNSLAWRYAENEDYENARKQEAKAEALNVLFWAIVDKEERAKDEQEGEQVL